MNKYKIFSNAKINIGLNVFQKEDDGYHNIDSIMVPIDLSDEMDITFYSELGDLKIECSDKNIPTDERNILYKTYKIFYKVKHWNYHNQSHSLCRTKTKPIS